MAERVEGATSTFREAPDSESARTGAGGGAGTDPAETAKGEPKKAAVLLPLLEDAPSRGEGSGEGSAPSPFTAYNDALPALVGAEVSTVSILRLPVLPAEADSERRCSCGAGVGRRVQASMGEREPEGRR